MVQAITVCWASDVTQQHQNEGETEVSNSPRAPYAVTSSSI